MKKIFIIMFIFMNIFLNPSDFIQWKNSLDYPDIDSIMNMSFLNFYNIDNEGFVFIKDRHFFTKSGRIRFFGINLTFDACFPSREQAEKIASQIAGLGINIVRLHHIDRSEIWGVNKNELSKFDPDQLEKLDYLIYQFKKRGIYINMNLHVSLQYTNKKDHPAYNVIRNIECFRYGKGMDNFILEFIDMQKKYASELLNHKNKFTGLLYKEDPVIAMVEINNENSLYKTLLVEEGLDFLPEEYKKYLDDKFIKYLSGKYKSIFALKNSWKIEEKKVNEINNIMPFNKENGWYSQVTDQNKGSINLKENIINVKLNYNEKNGLFQTFKKKLSFVKNKDYTIVIEIKGDRGSNFTVSVMRDELPWDNIGLSKTVKLTKGDFETIILGFTANCDINNKARINLSAFSNSKEFIIKSIKLYEGKIFYNPLKNVNSFERIKLVSLINFENCPVGYKMDFMNFLHDIEKSYWTGMIEFLKKEMNIKVPITGTQIDYSYMDFSDIYDYVDIHNYWQHPSFPGKRWDQNNYYVKNLSMTADKSSTFNKIIVHRIKDKPYTISEYNHPFPNIYNSETITMLSVISKLQDYDAVFYFNFLNNLNDLDSVSYFSLYKKFNSKAFFPVAGYIFRNDNIRSLSNYIELPVNKNDIHYINDSIKRYNNPYYEAISDYKKTDYDFSFYKKNKIFTKIGLFEKIINYDLKEYDNLKTQTDDRFEWQKDFNEYKNSYFKFDDESAKVFIGWNVKKNYKISNIELNFDEEENNFFQFAIFNKDSIIGNKGSYIVVLSGKSYFDNTDYYDYDKNTLIDKKSENYGIKLKVKINKGGNNEFIETFKCTLTIKLDKDYKNISVFAIDHLGLKYKEVKFIKKNSELIIYLMPQYGSIAYCIDIK